MATLSRIMGEEIRVRMWNSDNKLSTSEVFVLLPALALIIG